MMLPSFLICTRDRSGGEWAPEQHVEISVVEAVERAKALAAAGARAVCVMEIGGSGALPTFTFKYATKGR